MITLLKLVGAPGSFGFILCGLVVGVLLRYRWPRYRRVANIWLVTFAALHLVLALPAVAYPIADALHPYRPLAAIPQAKPLIVLDGDNRRGRLSVATQIHRRWPMTRVIVLGEDWLVGQLRDLGVPNAYITRESGPATTREQMEWVRDFVHSRPQAKPVVVVSRLQMPRAAALVKALNLDAILIASPVDIEPDRSGLRAFTPTYGALRMSRDAIYEHAALVYYSRLGWIEP